MDTLQSLLAAILANPDEDTPRLMYADELQSTGDFLDRALGEYIKLSIELANHKKPGLPNTTLREAYRKGIDLRDKATQLWDNGVIGHPNLRYLWSSVSNWREYRGFICSITCTASQFLSISDKLIWHESMQCDGCYIGGATSLPDGYTVKIENQVWGSYSRTEEYPKQPLCRLCRGSRKRHCPLTAHPVREIEITEVIGQEQGIMIRRWVDMPYGIDFTVYGPNGVWPSTKVVGKPA